MLRPGVKSLVKSGPVTATSNGLVTDDRLVGSMADGSRCTGEAPEAAHVAYPDQPGPTMELGEWSGGPTKKKVWFAARTFSSHDSDSWSECAPSHFVTCPPSETLRRSPPSGRTLSSGRTPPSRRIVGVSAGLGEVGEADAEGAGQRKPSGASARGGARSLRRACTPRARAC